MQKLTLAIKLFCLVGSISAFHKHTSSVVSEKLSRSQEGEKPVVNVITFKEQRDKVEEITVPQGKVLELRIEDLPSTGAEWKLTNAKELKDSHILDIDGRPENEEGNHGSGELGTESYEIFRFKALAADNFVAEFALRQRWEDEGGEVLKVSITVVAPASALEDLEFDYSTIPLLSMENLYAYIEHNKKNLPSVKYPKHLADQAPATYDPRQDPNRKACIQPSLDQKQCGSCWAFATAQTFSDRACIQSQGKIVQQFSPQFLVSCTTKTYNPNFISQACQGGWPTEAWTVITEYGLPLDSAVPYVDGQSQSTKSALSCASAQTQGKTGKYFLKANKDGLKTFYDVASLKYELWKNGPITGATLITNNVFNYKAGQSPINPNASTNAGGHAMELVGYGNKNGKDYWIFKNSWSTRYGDNGFLEIYHTTHTAQFMRYGFPSDSIILPGGSSTPGC